MAEPLDLAVFVGARGRGSNLRAIADAITSGKLNARIALVVGSSANAPVIDYARETNLRAALVNPKTCANEDDYAQTLLALLKDVGTSTIVLAGYLRRVPSPVLAAFPNRVVNIHPSLLPAFGGKGMYGAHVHQAVLDYGAKYTGCTVHFVDETYDTGPVILQRAVPVQDTDTSETLAARVLTEEHAALIEALQLLSQDRLQVSGRRVTVLHKILID